MMFVKISHVLFLLTIAAELFVLISTNDNLSECSNTDLAQEWDDPLLLLSTLDGSFIGVSQNTGFVRWKLKDEPVVKVPLDTSKAIVPLFLPDPKDGSLYVLGGSDHDALKKLPFTIPQLVASSPCRSSDGILYTGKKVDTWFSVDPKTGAKQQILSFDKVDGTCPISNLDAIFIGRTEYNIMMLDSKNKERRWNVTFFDYSSNAMEAETFKNYELVHFTASSTGRALTLNRRLGSLLWERNYGSPIIAVYVLESEGLVTVPFTSVAEETLDHLVEHFSSSPKPIIGTDDIKLYPTLYVGEHRHGLYALPSLVDETTVTIAPTQSGPLLLEGPEETSVVRKQYIDHSTRIPLPGHNVKLLPNYVNLPITFQSLPKESYGTTQSYLILGHYKVPDYSKTILQIAGKSHPILRPTSENFVIVEKNETETRNFEDKSRSGLKITRQTNGKSNIGIQTEPLDDDNTQQSYWESLAGGNLTFLLSQDFFSLTYSTGKMWLNQQENKALKLVIIMCVGCILFMMWYVHTQVRVFQQLSQGSRGSTHSNSGSQNSSVTAFSEDIGGGDIRVGKITFNTDEILGKGCEGTFVFKGVFDNRAVAVKRILPECFNFADREVDLLRESDEHPHVVRYYCMEQDKQFRYIALELCAATLQDYVECRFDRSKINILEILHQATLGVEHLHALDIVHRDIKPHNVLISMANAKGEVRAMISDFGLCKKLKVGRVSFSRRSGITGTDGWIAPEMLNGGTRTTCSVDIFSLGCVFYYVLSNGKHPFGDSLRRQANILSGEFRLLDLDSEERALQRTLVEMMISAEAIDRPPASAIQKHPIFWNNARVLSFFQDVSDRIEKEGQASSVLQVLEKDSMNVVRDDWRNHIDAEVAQDLRKYRNYTGTSIRDLLRALRNKKHHYRELSEDAQKNLGEIPNKFIDYWTSRFPHLLLHTWLTMQCVKKEPIFNHYYHNDYYFNHSAHLRSSDRNYDRSTGFLPENVGIINYWVKRKSPQSTPKKGKASNFIPKSQFPKVNYSQELHNTEMKEYNFSPKGRRHNIQGGLESDSTNWGTSNNGTPNFENSDNWRKQGDGYSTNWRKEDDPVRRDEFYRYWTNIEYSKESQDTIFPFIPQNILSRVRQQFPKPVGNSGPDQHPTVNSSLEDPLKPIEESVAEHLGEQVDPRKWGQEGQVWKGNRPRRGRRSKQKNVEVPLEWTLPSSSAGDS